MDKPREGLSEELLELLQGAVPETLEETEVGFLELISGAGDLRVYNDPDLDELLSEERLGKLMSHWLRDHESSVGHVTELVDWTLSHLPPRSGFAAEYRVYLLLAYYRFLVSRGFVIPSVDQVAVLLGLAGELPPIDDRIIFTDEVAGYPIFEVLMPLAVGDPSFLSQFLLRFPEEERPSVIALLARVIFSGFHDRIWPEGRFSPTLWGKYGLSRDEWARMNHKERERVLAEQPGAENVELLKEENDLSRSLFTSRKRAMLTSLAQIIVPLLGQVEPDSLLAVDIIHSLLEPTLGSYPLDEVCPFVRASAGDSGMSGNLAEACGVPKEDLGGDPSVYFRDDGRDYNTEDEAESDEPESDSD